MLPLNDDAIFETAKCYAVAFMEIEFARQRRGEANGQTISVSGDLRFGHRVYGSIHNREMSLIRVSPLRTVVAAVKDPDWLLR